VVVSENWWRSQEYGIRERSQAWENALSACYRRWELAGALPTTFAARIRRRNVARMTLIECICGPCQGERKQSVIRRDDEPYVCLQIVLSGTERFHTEGGISQLATGDCIVWNTTEPLEFHIPQDFHKSTLLIPYRLLRERLSPGCPIESFALDTRRGIGAMLCSHLFALTHQFDCIQSMDEYAIKWATIDLVAAAIADRHHCSRQSERFRQDLLEAVMKYIIDNLQDSELDLARIAGAHGMSIRYLHLLFKPLGQTVSSWIWEQRLLRCSDELLNSKSKDLYVTEIAYRWGFTDSSHFSRSFRKRFGISPTNYRALDKETA